MYLELHLPESLSLVTNQPAGFTDQQVTANVADVLANDPRVPRAAVRALVRDGVVTLSGQVEWSFQRKAAEDAVRSLRGISSVINGIAQDPHCRAEERLVPS